MSQSYRRVNIEISNICNLQCSFCPEVERPKKQMSLALFSQIAPQLQGKVDEVCLHLMGEPLLHPEFNQFLEICTRFQLPVALTSNGMLLQGARREQCLQGIVRQINLSLHSFEANFPNRDIEPYFEKILRFIQVAEETRPDLYINLRVWDLVEVQALSPTNQQLLAKLQEAFAFDLNQHPIDIRRRKNLRLRGRIYLHFDSRFQWPDPKLPVLSKKGFCHGLSSHFGILADGTVVPCCLDKEARIPLGQSQEQSLEEILQSPRAEAMRSGFARGERVEDLCQRCPFIQRFSGKAERLTQNAKAKRQTSPNQPS